MRGVCDEETTEVAAGFTIDVYRCGVRISN
jgi:hypothetical protein